MATDNNEENNFGPSNVLFDLEESQNPHDFDASLDEVDEFLELSTLSNRPSNSSLDSTTNIFSNGSTINTKTSSINGTSDENKSTLKRYRR
jgi:hypothetical protein